MSNPYGIEIEVIRHDRFVVEMLPKAIVEKEYPIAVALNIVIVGINLVGYGYLAG